jgi:hypothetical protein
LLCLPPVGRRSRHLPGESPHFPATSTTQRQVVPFRIHVANFVARAHLVQLAVDADFWTIGKLEIENVFTVFVAFESTPLEKVPRVDVGLCPPVNKNSRWRG